MTEPIKPWDLDKEVATLHHDLFYRGSQVATSIHDMPYVEQALLKALRRAYSAGYHTGVDAMTPPTKKPSKPVIPPELKEP